MTDNTDYFAGKGNINTIDKLKIGLFNRIDKPVTRFREIFVDPFKKPGVYYHRELKRVPTVDQCGVEDMVCQYEANAQFLRDKKVDQQIIQILRQRRIECEFYYHEDFSTKCKKTVVDYQTAYDNYFIKYGDLGATGTARDAYNKQRHRMIWEKRYGPVGTGMNPNVTEQQPVTTSMYCDTPYRV